MPSPIHLCEIAANVRAKRERRKDARPGELLEAALELFVEKGFAATRVEEVAKRAGVSKGTLFLYFSSKEELFKAVVRENLSGKFAEWNAMFDSFTGSTPEMLRFCMNSWWERIGSTKASGITKLMMSEAGNFPELAEFYRAEVICPGNLLIERMLQRGMDRGEFKPMDVHQMAYSVMAPMLFLALWSHSFGCMTAADQRMNPEQFLACHVDTLLYGVCLPGKQLTKQTPAQGIMASLPPLAPHIELN